MFSWFKKTPPPAAEPVPTPEEEYSTHTRGDPRMSRLEKIRIAIGKSIQVRPQDMVSVSASGETTAMDDSEGMGTAKQAFNRFSTGVPDAQLIWYASQGFIGHHMCALMAQHWLVGKICNVPPRDAVRTGYDISFPDASNMPDDAIQRFQAFDKRMRLNEKLIEYATNARVFGIRIALFQVKSNDPLYYEKPFNPDGVTKGSYKGISQIDPIWCAPELSGAEASNPLSQHFYEPMFWIINGRRIHRSHMRISVPSPVTDLLKPSYQFGGISIPQKIYERVYAAERTANEAPLLAMTKRTNFLFTDMEKVMANPELFAERMQQWVEYRDNHGVKILGEGDKADQKDTSLADLDSVIMTQYQLCCAIGDSPATKILGTTPKGFNATGEAEEANYHELLETIHMDLDPLLERHYLCLSRSLLGVATQPTVTWHPLDALTSKELAEVNLAKSQADKNLVDAGALDGHAILERLSKENDSGYFGIPTIAPEVPPDPVVPDDGDILQ